MTESPRPDTVTWLTGAPMILVDRGMVERPFTDQAGKQQVVRYRVAVLKPISTEGSDAWTQA